ncbi:hypothetical protein EV659_10513 [Rhodothalassium salexigens DSM 2132]|uniref:Uncharacterized protein n=1 Tax=Rhodothalassium salexigens DSM 2132 TaxID=1188247 RepID=A0A4R2PIH5_RHOSA|nr:hypothetical protein [Rhodothalassium salexigens DSM 2132]TCP34388.1 hypothetical protein EV659_10513 [Rhodothalassium salexigens DSM 2132]
MITVQTRQAALYTVRRSRRSRRLQNRLGA